MGNRKGQKNYSEGIKQTIIAEQKEANPKCAKGKPSYYTKSLAAISERKTVSELR